MGSGAFIILFLRDVINNRGVGGKRKEYAKLGQIDKPILLNRYRYLVRGVYYKAVDGSGKTDYVF